MENAKRKCKGQRKGTNGNGIGENGKTGKGKAKTGKVKKGTGKNDWRSGWIAAPAGGKGNVIPNEKAWVMCCPHVRFIFKNDSESSHLAKHGRCTRTSNVCLYGRNLNAGTQMLLSTFAPQSVTDAGRTGQGDDSNGQGWDRNCKGRKATTRGKGEPKKGDNGNGKKGDTCKRPLAVATVWGWSWQEWSPHSPYPKRVGR